MFSLSNTKFPYRKLFVDFRIEKCGNLTFCPIFIWPKTESDVSPMKSAHRASRFPAKPLRWHKLVPVGVGIAEESVDLAPLPLIPVPQNRWVTGGQLDSGHLLL